MRNGFAQTVSALAAGLVLLLFRLYLLPENGPPDFDTVSNWQVAQEIASADFSRLFHHRAPLFNLFYGAVALFTAKLQILIAVNALFNMVAVVVLCKLAQQYLRLNWLLFILLMLAVGLSVFLVHTSRYLTIESASLPFFALFLWAYLQRCQKQEVKYWYWSLFWLAVGLSINYKMVLALPILLLLELLNPTPFLKGKPLFYGFGILLLPVLVWSFLGLLVGLPWYRYLGAYAGVTRFNVPNAAMRTGKFQSDISFYFQYLFRFESPLVWVALLGYPLLFRPWQYLRKRALELPDVLAVFCFAFLLGMSVLLKAPRGLVFIYGPLYMLGFLCLYRLMPGRKVLLAGLLLLSALYTGVLCQRYIFRYSGNGYQQMATELQKRQIQPVVQTVGNGLVPFQAALQGQVISVSRWEELENIRNQRASYAVLDTYYLATGIKKFGKLESLPALVTIEEPGLVSPLFFLEHAEFTGLGFSQTMELRNQALQKKGQLRLVRLP